MGYFAAIRIRDSAISVGEELGRNFPMGKREKTNYAVLDFTRRMQLLGNGKGYADGILIEWKVVGIADNCAQPLLRIQALTNTIRQVAEGNSTPPNIPERRRTYKHGNTRKDEIWQTPGKHGNLPMREKSMRHTGFRQQNPNRNTTDKRTGAQETHGAIRL